MLLVRHQWPWPSKAPGVREANRANGALCQSQLPNLVCLKRRRTPGQEWWHIVFKKHLLPYGSDIYVPRSPDRCGEKGQEGGHTTNGGSKWTDETQRKSQEENQHLLPTQLGFLGHWPCKWGEKVKGKQGNGPMARCDDQVLSRHQHKQICTNDMLNEQQS